MEYAGGTCGGGGGGGWCWCSNGFELGIPYGRYLASGCCCIEETGCGWFHIGCAIGC